MPFFTRTGDDGTTGLLGKSRLPKEHRRLEAIGTVDEVNSVLGLARVQTQTPIAAGMLLHIQRDLYALMAELAATADTKGKFQLIEARHVTWLEEQIAILESQVKMPREFIVPGDSLGGAALDLARTIVRRAERRVVDLWHHDELKNPEVLRYLNRLSSLCFVLELSEAKTAGRENPTLAKDNQ